VFSSVKALVEAGGGSLANVVKITTYVTDVRYRLDFRAVRDEGLGAKGPASTMVQVSSLSPPGLPDRGRGPRGRLVTWGPRRAPQSPQRSEAPRR